MGMGGIFVLHFWRVPQRSGISSAKGIGCFKSLIKERRTELNYKSSVYFAAFLVLFVVKNETQSQQGRHRDHKD